MPTLPVKIPFLLGEEEEEGRARGVAEAEEDVSISEDWLRRTMANYDASDSEDRFSLSGQDHVDIRSFMAGSGEEWTVGTIGPQTILDKLPGISIPYSTGTTITESFMPEKPINLSRAFEASDFISLALPEFPKEVEPDFSFLELSSDPSGEFETQTVSIPFSDSLLAIEEGNSEFRVERSAIETEGLNLNAVTGVRFKIGASGAGTIVLSGLRLISKTWQLATVDFDNEFGCWRNPVPSNGDPGVAPTFAVPAIWRSASPPGERDPRPIDTEFGVGIYTGSQESSNTFTLFLREINKAFLTQLDLDGVAMSELDGKSQPDLGTSLYGGREMVELDRFTMEELDGHNVFDLERTSDEVQKGWVEFSFTWGAANTLRITNSSSPGYNFETPSLNSNERYFLRLTLEGNSARFAIHGVKPDFSLNPTPVFDTTLINDDGVFKRRKGRVGWQASLGDNDAFVENIRTRKLNFAEYRSKPLRSITPVKGAQLYANFTPNGEGWETFAPAPTNTESGSSLSRDTNRSTTGESFRIDTFGRVKEQGVISNIFKLTEFAQSGISFDIWYPSSLVAEAEALGETPGVKARLVGDFKTPSIDLALPEIQPDQWQHVPSIDLSIYELNPTGQYSLLIYQPSGASGSWWIDNTKVFQRAMQWSARSVVDDPWESNFAPWTDFREVINSDQSGILFTIRGKELQMRSRALTQDATVVQAPKLVPTYQELGRIVWPEEGLTGITGPSANFSEPEITEPLNQLELLDSLTTGVPPLYYEIGNWSKMTWAEHPLVPTTSGATSGGFGEFDGSYWNHTFSGNHAIAMTRTLAGKNHGTRFHELWVCLNPNHSGYKVKFLSIGDSGGTSKASKFSATLFKVVEGTETELKKETGFEYHPEENLSLVRKGTALTAYRQLGGGPWESLVATTSSTFASGFIGLGGADEAFWTNLQGANEVIEGLDYTFSDTSTAGSSPIVYREWIFGDGTKATGPRVSHSYAKHGTYHVTLVVVDAHGQQSQITKTLTI